MTKAMPDFVLDNLAGLRTARMSKGLSITDLKLSTGVSSTLIYNCENGNARGSRISYNKLAGFFGWKLWPERKRSGRR